MEARVEACDIDDFRKVMVTCSHQSDRRGIVPAMGLAGAVSGCRGISYKGARSESFSIFSNVLLSMS